MYFSVILPAYNTPPSILKRAINSVLNQTYPYFELIVVDDGSTPSLEPIVKEYNDERIIFIRHEKNRGPAKAHNSGIKYAKYDWIAFISHDDEWLDNKLKVINEEIKRHKDFYFYYTDLNYYNNNILSEYLNQTLFFDSEFMFNELLKRNFIYTSTIVVHKRIFKEIGLFDESGALMDHDLYLRIAKKFKIIGIKEKLVNYYHSPLGITHPKHKQIIKNENTNSYLLYKKWRTEFIKAFSKKELSIKFNTIALEYNKRQYLSLAIKCFLYGISVYPYWRGNYFDLIKTIFNFYKKLNNKIFLILIKNLNLHYK